MCLLDSQSKDIILFKRYLLNDYNNKIGPNGEIPKYKESQLRLKNDLENLAYLSNKIQDNLKNIKKNPKVINVNEAIMIYLKKIFKKKYNLIFFLLLNEVNILRKSKNPEFSNNIKLVLKEINLRKFKHFTLFNEEIFFKDLQTEKNSIINNESERSNPKLYEDLSPFMSIIKRSLFPNRNYFTLNYIKYFENNFLYFTDLCCAG